MPKFLTHKQRGSISIEAAFVFCGMAFLFVVLASFLLAWHGEELQLQAARAAANEASVVIPVGDTQSLALNATSTCQLVASVVTCDNGIAVTSAASFTSIVAAAQAIDATVSEDNLIVRYTKTAAVNPNNASENASFIVVELTSNNLFAWVPGLASIVPNVFKVTAVQQAY